MGKSKKRVPFPRRLFPFLPLIRPIPRLDYIFFDYTIWPIPPPLSIQPINLALNERALSYILRHRGRRREETDQNENDAKMKDTPSSHV